MRPYHYAYDNFISEETYKSKVIQLKKKNTDESVIYSVTVINEEFVFIRQLHYKMFESLWLNGARVNWQRSKNRINFSTSLRTTRKLEEIYWSPWKEWKAKCGWFIFTMTFLCMFWWHFVDAETSDDSLLN